MTYQEGRAGLQLVAERDVGQPLRAHNRAQDALEDRSLEALRREQDRVT
jgi:hypothetical protein